MAKEYDLVVIGGGVGGYTGAIKAAKEGLSVALVENLMIGGTCLNRGCIPTKAYLKSAEVRRNLEHISEMGVDVKNFDINFLQVKKRKDEIVKKLRNGVSSLLKMNKIDYFEGEGSVLGTSIFTPKAGSVMIKPSNGDDEIILTPENVLIATGSRPTSIPNVEVDEQNILTSNGILEIEQLPESIVIIGGGVIGVEWASLLTDLGVKVTIVEFLDRLIPNEPKKVSTQLKKELETRGVEIHLQASVQSATVKNNQVEIIAKESETEIKLNAEKVLVAVGRKPNIENIGLESAGVEHDKKGIMVNEFYQTNVSGIYAIGDVIPTQQLAHVAAKEAELAVDAMLKKTYPPLDYDNIPRGIYTYPEIASVGLVAGEKFDQKKLLKGKFDFQFNGKALIEGETIGQVEMFTDKETDDFIGLSIVGPHATDLISEGALGLYLNATPEEIGDTVHPHPTLAETIMEAAHDTFGKSTNK